MSENNHFSENIIAYRFSHRFGAMLKKILSLPKTIYFNFRCFDTRTAIKLPVLVAYEVRLKSIYKGAVAIKSPVHRFMVKIGFGGAEAIMPHRSNVCLTGGQVTFHGTADLGAGISLVNAGQLDIGADCFMNNNCTVWCSKQISLGDNLLCGWGVLLRDSDGHTMIENGETKPHMKPICIGNHVWLGSESSVLKGASLGDHSVLAMQSLLNKPYPQQNVLVAGMPAKLIRENVSWIR